MGNSLTNKQISFIMYCAIVGYSVIHLPHNISKTLGTASWIPLLVATLIFVLITSIILYLQSTYENQTLFEYSNLLFGKYLGWIVTFIFTLYYFIFFTMLSRMYCETIKLIVLPKTPIIYLLLVFYIVVFFLLSKDIYTLGRMCELYGTLNIIILIFIIIALFTEGEFINMKPFFIKRNVNVYLQSIMQMGLPLLGLEVLFFVPLNKKDNKGVLKYGVITIFSIGILYTCLLESSLSVVGTDTLILSKATLASITKGLNLPFLEFLKRLDGFYLLFWIMNSICSMGIWGFGISEFVSKLFNIKKNNILLIIIIFIAFIVSLQPSTIPQIENILNYGTYFGFILVALMSITLFIITKVKKYDKNTN